MSRTSRTARAPRAAAVVRTPSLLLLPLLVGAALAALWLAGAPSAHADTAGPLDLERNTASLDTGLTGNLEPSLETGVAEVAAPVTGTLGTVRRSLEERTGAAPATVLSDPAVTEVGEGVHEGARRVVRELAAVDRDHAENLVAHVASTRVVPAAPEETAPADPQDASAAPGTDREERGEDAAGPAGDTAPGTAHALLQRPRPAGAVAEAAPVDGHRAADSTDRGVSVPGAPKLSTGSSAPVGAGTPAVAGYLSVVPVTAPAADALSTAVDAVHPVPAGAADDPTVSPD